MYSIAKKKMMEILTHAAAWHGTTCFQWQVSCLIHEEH